MTEENITAKEPDRKSDWTAIDIFLFSNGQHYSPPRKYHLMTNQLDWWNNTLTYLAKSQFGSGHSMVDLYTMEGTKVDNPLQLKHNTAYVAVVPPEYFINASYEKYLIKATRSWEKSQARRFSNTTISNQEENQDLEGKSNYGNKESESTYTKAMRDGSVTLKTIVASMVDNQLSEIVKPNNDTLDKTMNNKSNINPVKQLDKLNRLSTQRPALVKNINSITSSTKARKPPIKMKDCVKINTNSAFGRPSPNLNNKFVSKDKFFKPLHRIQDLPEPAPTRNEELLKSSATKLINKTLLAKTLAVENETLEKNGSSEFHLYNNPQSEKPSIAFPVNARLSTVTNVNRQGGTHELFDVSYPPILVNNLEDTAEYSIAATTASSLESKPCDPPLHSKELFIPPDNSIQSTPQNNVDYINKEGTHLKLNIEIWNAPIEAKYSHSAARESLCILHTEKGSQVEIEDKTLDQHKTLQKTIERELNDNEGNNKIIIVKCSCLNQCCDVNIKTEIEQNNKNNMFRVNNANSKILIFLPVLKLDENCKRCDCYKEHKETNMFNQNPVCDEIMKKTDKTASCISLYKSKMDKIASHAEIFSRNNSIEIKVETHDKNESTLVKRKSVAIREDLILPEVENVKQPSRGILDESSKVLPKIQEPPKALIKGQELSKLKVQEPSKVSLKPHESIKVLMKPQEPAITDKHEIFKNESTGRAHISSNKSTQTEYCDVLVEARLQSDGHYSFYLPPLNIVKHYKL